MHIYGYFAVAVDVSDYRPLNEERGKALGLFPFFFL